MNDLCNYAQAVKVRSSKDPQKAYEQLMVSRRMKSLDDKIKEIMQDRELSESKKTKR